MPLIARCPLSWARDPTWSLRTCEALSRTETRRVFNLLLRRAKITPGVVDAMQSWHHSGFSAHTATRVTPEEPQAAKRVLRCLLPSAALTPTACSSRRIFHPTCDPTGSRLQPVRPGATHTAPSS